MLYPAVQLVESGTPRILKSTALFQGSPKLFDRLVGPKMILGFVDLADREATAFLDM